MTPTPQAPDPVPVPCLIAGGGPAGIVLGYLLARAGVGVRIFEKHADFLRDFRGDTVHPSTLEMLDQIGLLPAFERLPQQRVQQLSVQIGQHVQPVVDFSGLSPFDHLALVPQWSFLNLLAEHGRRMPHFDLRMGHEVLSPIATAGRIVGLRVRSPAGDANHRAELVVACDGRDSILRTAAGLDVKTLGAPMDVLWFRLPRTGDAPGTFAIVGAGRMMVLLDRDTYWQAAYLVAKGSADAMRAKPLAQLRGAVAALAPFLEGPSTALESWEQVRTLEVRVDRLQHWHRSGLLCIGDAAHAMSPIGGVGINLAIQDAIAASNALAAPLASGAPIEDSLLGRIQRRRQLPVQLTQWMQTQVQRRVIAQVLSQRTEPPHMPRVLRWLLGYRFVRSLPARFLGYGLRRERVLTREATST